MVYFVDVEGIVLTILLVNNSFCDVKDIHSILYGNILIASVSSDHQERIAWDVDCATLSLMKLGILPQITESYV
jgi:hypothetical protein